MVGWHHWLDGHEFEQAPGVGDGLGSLACCSPWGRKESGPTQQLNNRNDHYSVQSLSHVWFLCDPVDYNLSGSSVLHHLPESTHIHVH